MSDVEKIIIFSWVEKMEQRSRRIWVRGFGKEAEFEDEPLGWFMLLKGSHEAIHIGFDTPTFGPSHPVKITIERA